MGTAKNGEQNSNGTPAPNQTNGSSKAKTEEVDQYPEAAFNLVGSIEEAIEKGEKMLADAK